MLHKYINLLSVGWPIGPELRFWLVPSCTVEDGLGPHCPNNHDHVRNLICCHTFNTWRIQKEMHGDQDQNLDNWSSQS